MNLENAEINFFPGIWPPENTVQKVSMFFIDIGEVGRQLYYGIHAFIFCALFFLSLYTWFTENSTTNRSEPSTIKRIILSDYIFLILVFALILMARIPLASNGILNPDEPYWVAEAKTLWYDLRPWISVDTGTGGPIVPLSLLSLKLFGLPIDQGSIKIVGGAMMALSTVFVFLGLARVMGSTLSRLFTLPLAVVFSAMKSNDLTAYNSEHAVILLTSISFFFFCRLYTEGKGRFLINLVLLGLLLGLVPYAKLQGVPIALFIGLSAFLIVYKRMPKAELFVLVACALLPTILLLFALMSYGGLQDFWVSYLGYNLHYSSQIAIQDGSLSSRIRLFLDLLFLAPELHLYTYLSGAVIVTGALAVPFLLYKINKTSIMEILFALLLMGVSVFSIVAPGRPFLHYILLSIVPITILSASFAQVIMGVKIHFFSSHERLFKITKALLMIFFLVTTGFFYFRDISVNTIDYLGKAREHYDGFAPQGLLGAALDHYFSKGARIAVWEYEPELFEGNDFLIGTRYAGTAFHLQTSKQNYYISRYLNDLKLFKPELFVESVTRSTHGVKYYPSIAEYISENYILDATIDGYTVYVRKDKIATDRFWQIENKTIKSNMIEFHSDLQALKRNGDFLYFRGWTVLREDVINQRVFLRLMNKQDTLMIPSHQIANSAVVDFSGKKNYRMCGFLGFFPIREIPKGEYQVGLLVKNKNDIGFQLTSRILNPDSLLRD